MLKKFVIHIGVGLAIGSVVSTICLALMGGVNSTLMQVMAWLAASALCGVASMIYDIESLPLPLMIGLHAVLCFGIALATGSLLGYGEHFGSRLLLMLPIFIVIYLIISLGAWLYGRYCAKTTNERLEKK
ncbi:MAG: DUF3021 domain-containing protein [Candidatus Pelethousia sp.]|nr:DUF3021 domain-containing protein [Candidatus Pelethousia sp.]